MMPPKDGAPRTHGSPATNHARHTTRRAVATYIVAALWMVAPMPDGGLSAPKDTPRPDHTTLRPDMWTLGNEEYRGDGFPYGSTASAMANAKELRVPGVILRVPLD
jgi:hypothetical protein